MPDPTTNELDLMRREVWRGQIRDALYRYCRGVDRADIDMFLSAFHPGAREDHGAYHGPVEDFAHLTTERVGLGTIGIQHVLGNILVQFEDDHAQVETYFRAFYRDRANPDIFVAVGGRYLDRFEQRDGHWRIARRYVVNDWSTRQEIPADVAGSSAYPSGSPDRNDPLFQPDIWAPYNADIFGD
ncbi:MAG: nuclear transport factor 2 family protein [Sphingobium sp.]